MIDDLAVCPLSAINFPVGSSDYLQLIEVES